jgi:cellulose synthase/poly-beta-1,6-N-acetylglucosamine synthase-like glycosyltransferase
VSLPFSGKDRAIRMKLSVVVPCHHELDTMLEIVQRVKAIDVDDIEIIVKVIAFASF